MEEGGYTRRRKENPRNPSRYPNVTFFLTLRWSLASRQNGVYNPNT